jgi:sarcosine oxidase subunit gamma
VAERPPSEASPRGANLAAPEAVWIEARDPAGILHLAEPRDGPALRSLLAALGAGDLPPPGRSVGSGARCLLGMGLARWWVVEEEPAATGLAACAEAFTIVADASDGWARLRIGGPAVLDLLAKGCALDLDPRAFPAGACAFTAFAHVHALLHRAEREAHFDLYCGTSLARSLREWLAEAAAEFGGGTPPWKGGPTTA